MKKLLLKALSAITAGIILASAVIPSSALSAEKEPCDIMIYADENYFSDTTSAREYLERLTKGNIEITDTYSLALFGFSARVPQSYIEVIDSSKYFDAHESGYFAPLSFEERKYDTASAYASEMMGITPAHESGHLGSGTVVAVIDNGFDITHEAFAKLPENPSITKADVDRLISDGQLNVDGAASLDGIFVSDKIPFAFNYAARSSDVSTLDSHGTHVSAIIGGNSKAVSGVAPECQLLFMKVFDQNTSNASEQYVVSALEDAIALGADVINLSIGSYSGSSQAKKYSSMDRMAEHLTNAGITVVCAAGNDGSAGDASSYASYLELPYPLAKTPDYGTVNHPAVIKDYIAVASAQNTHVAYDTLVHINGYGELYRIKYTDTNANLGIIKKTFTKHFDKQELEYVPIPGLGEAKDYDGLDLTGKIALIERGITTFIDKVNAAAAAGAVAAVIYDNVDGDEVYMELTGCNIPAVFISKEDGEYLTNASNKVLSFDSALSELVENEYAYRMSDFSSWGVTPEFELKPDITSVGESVYSAAAGGTYTSLSGTSMATPFISGIAALLNEKLDREESKYILSKRPSHIKNIIMNSALPLINTDTDAEFSPRQQGAGLADVKKALSAEVLLTDLDGSPSLILKKEDNNKYSFEFTAENLTDKELTLTINTSTLCDEYATVPVEINGKEQTYIFNTLTSRKLYKSTVTPEENSGLKATGSNAYTYTLGAEEKLTAKLYITLDNEELDGNEVFEDGYFVDGFIYAHTENAVSSIPFTGFSGNFDEADIFDTTVYEETLPFFTGNALTSQNEDESYSILGSPDGTVNGAVEALAAFSPNGDGVFDTLSFSPSLLRNVSGLSVDIISEAGELLFSESYTNTPMTKGGIERNDVIPLWDGSDGLYDDFIFPDGRYTAKITAYQGGQKTSQMLSLDFVIDTSAPKYWLESSDNKNGVKTVTLAIKDNHAVKSIEFYNNAKQTVELTTSDALPATDRVTTLTYDVSHITEDHIWADITDYAMNTKTVKIRIP